ncbi:NADPH-dependent FMN reductase, partial [Vibrio sp. 1403]|nr:NADPH-dependent FMN reductase [Vibrio sp. 1403]
MPACLTFILQSIKREQRNITMKIVAFGASTSSTSINKTLATYAAQQVEGAQV